MGILTPAEPPGPARLRSLASVSALSILFLAVVQMAMRPIVGRFPEAVFLLIHPLASWGFFLIGAGLLLDARKRLGRPLHFLFGGAACMLSVMGYTGAGSPDWDTLSTGVVFLLGLGLAAQGTRGWIPNLVSQAAACSALFFCVLMLIGYFYDVHFARGLPDILQMHWYLAFTGLLGGLGLIFRIPGYGIVSVFSGAGVGSQTIRRLFLPAVVLFIGFGWLRLRGELLGLYTPAFGAALYISMVIAGLAALLFSSGNRMNHLDASRSHREEEIRRLNADLEERNRGQKEANRELEAFSYSVSHDLRAPLRHIAGFGTMLARRSRDSLDEESRRYLDVIQDSVNKMSALIDDLLRFSRTGRAQLSHEPVSMDRLVREVRGGLEEGDPGRKITWEIASLPETIGDEPLLRQVWENLLGNAWKYTRKTEAPRIRVEGARRDGETVYRVEDNGVGFDMRYAEKLFGVFQRLHSGEEYEGTGIGLALARRILERHGGRIWAESEPGRGATFYFSLPDSPPEIRPEAGA